MLLEQEIAELLSYYPEAKMTSRCLVVLSTSCTTIEKYLYVGGKLNECWSAYTMNETAC